MEKNLKKELLECINEARMNPMKYANKLILIMSYVSKRDAILREPNRPIVKLNEGLKAYEEAISFLKNLRPLSPFVLESTLSKISQERAEQIIKENSTDNLITEKFNRYGTFSEISNIIIKEDKEPIRIIFDLIVCDGDKNRTNRNILFSDYLTQIGIGISRDFMKFALVIDCFRNWRIKQSRPSGVNVDENISKALSQMKLFKNEFNQSSGNSNINFNIEEAKERFEKDEENDLWIDNAISRDDEKQFIDEIHRVLMIKKSVFTMPNGKKRIIIKSKTLIKENKS